MAKTKSETGLRLREIAPNEWVFEGARDSARDDDRLYAAIELLGSNPERAAAALRKLTAANPEHLDARHHLAIALQYAGDNEGAMEQWTHAAELGLKALPPSFCFGRDRLEWGWLQNRPFLRAFHGLATAMLDAGLLGEATLILTNILDLNPGDNQGVRMLLVGCWFRARRPADVLRVCDRYPDDGSPDLLYGRGLAHLKLGNEAEAAAALAEAVRYSPRVRDELLKSRHTAPKQEFPGYITVGGADEAYAYWEESRDLWKETRGALALLKRVTPAPAPARKNP